MKNKYKKLSLLFPLILVIVLLSYADKTDVDPSKEYLDKLDSVVTKLENLQLKCSAYLELNKSYINAGINPNVNLIEEAIHTWAEIENCYKNEYLTSLKSSNLVGEETANKSRFEELQNRANSSYGIWNYREIILSQLKTPKSNTESKEIIDNLINYYKSRNCSPFDMIALAGSIQDYDKEKSTELVTSLTCPYIKTIGFVRINDFNEALNSLKSIKDTTELLNSLIMLLDEMYIGDKPESIKKEDYDRLVDLIDSKDFIKNYIYSCEKIINTISIYSFDEASNLINKIPDEFPDIKLACILILKENNYSYQWDENQIAKLCENIENTYSKESLIAKYLILKAKSIDDPFPLPVKLDLQIFADQVNSAILFNHLIDNPKKYFFKADSLITDPTMLFQFQLSAVIMIAREDKKDIGKYFDILYGDLSKVPDKSVLVDLLRVQSEFDVEKAADKISEIENPILRCRLYSEISKKLHNDNINLSEVLYQKALYTFNGLSDISFTDKVKLLSDLALNRAGSNPDDTKKILDRSSDILGSIN